MEEKFDKAADLFRGSCLVSVSAGLSGMFCGFLQSLQAFAGYCLC